MALWKDPSGQGLCRRHGGTHPLPVEPAVRAVDRPAPAMGPVAVDTVRRAAIAGPAGPAKESLIAADVTIEGKIEGAGTCASPPLQGRRQRAGQRHDRAGRARHRAGERRTVVVSGEVQGNIHATSRVELLESGVINATSRRPC